ARRRDEWLCCMHVSALTTARNDPRLSEQVCNGEIMTVRHALSAAFAAFIATCAFAHAQSVAPSASVTAGAEALTSGQIRSAVAELEDIMERKYVSPEFARQYASHLRERLAAGAYDGLTDPARLASTLQTELRAVHPDAHLRVNAITPSAAAGPHQSPRPSALDFGDDRWLADRVAYLRINLFTENAADVARMTAIMDRYATARTFIFDLRTCRGGALGTMN